MKIISHRGNLNGPESETENSPQKIEQALKLGYECEIDVWYESGNFTLCHDFKNNKRYNINAEFLKKWIMVSCKEYPGLISALQKNRCKLFLARG